MLTTPLREHLLIGAATTGAIWVTWKLFNSGRREAYLPPGPPTKPVVGNLLDFPATSPQHKLTEWARKYGEVYSLKLLSNNMVVVSSLEALRIIFEKNSALTSDRPSFYIGELVEGIDNDLVMARYGPRWRSLRRAAQQILSPQACRTHLAIQEAESMQLLYEIIQEPENVRLQLRRAATSVIMSVMFGVRIPFATDQIYLDFWRMLEDIVKLSASTTAPAVDRFPIMKLIPERFAKWKTECKELRERQRGVLHRMMAPVKQRLAKGEGNDCFMETVYTRAEEWGLDEEALLYFGAVMMEAGAETTSTFLTNFVLFLTANPHVQVKIHEEVDRVIGTDRMPKLDDFEQLPYLQATLNETHRFRPVTPLAVPHATIEDVRYGDYVIPKGTTIFQNTWGLFHDDAVFKNPGVFYPERFIEDPELGQYMDFSFGSGRRICAGIHLAKSAIAINAMNIAWGFSINKALAPDGTVIEPNVNEYLQGLVNAPKELSCFLKPRSMHHEQMIREMFHDMPSVFYPFEKDLEEKERLRAEQMRQNAY